MYTLVMLCDGQQAHFYFIRIYSITFKKEGLASDEIETI